MKKEKTTFEMRRIGPKRITFKLVLDSHYGVFFNSLKLLRQINDILPQLTGTYLDATRVDLSRRIQELDHEGKKQFDKYEEYSKNPKKRRVVIKHEEAAKLHHEGRDLFLFS